uniref:Tubulin-specific chaperone A n=1 Tax=Monopterus albus TaxID=43700 RepID=A0A3Q3PYN1_MONAL
MADPRIRQIRIKTGIVKRLAKEKISYITETKQQEEKIEHLKAEGGDVYVIKKQMEVLQECRMMIPDCHRRLAVAHADLLQLLTDKRICTRSSPFISSAVTAVTTGTRTRLIKGHEHRTVTSSLGSTSSC